MIYNVPVRERKESEREAAMTRGERHEAELERFAEAAIAVFEPWTAEGPVNQEAWSDEAFARRAAESARWKLEFQEWMTAVNVERTAKGLVPIGGPGTSSEEHV